MLYKFQLILRDRLSGELYTPHIFAFAERDLREQVYANIPFGFKLIRVVRQHPGSHSELFPLTRWGANVAIAP